MALNKWIGMGRLTKDPELKTTQGDTVFVNFSIAIDRMPDKNGNKQADFISCTAFNKTAEVVSKYFTKGKMIAVEGTLQNNDYTDQSGVKHFAMKVLVSSINFCGDNQNQQSRPNQRQYQGYSQYQPSLQNFVANAQAQGIPNYQQNPNLGIGNLDGFEEIISDGQVPF